MKKILATILLAILFAASYALTVVHAAEPLALELDQARLIHLPNKTSGIVIGNPLIADASMQGRDLVVLTGKSFGRTNIIFTDARGDVIAERELIVRNATGIVTVMRGIVRETYSCEPGCEPMPGLGDDAKTFTTQLSQIGARNGASTVGASTGSPKP